MVERGRSRKEGGHGLPREVKGEGKIRRNGTGKMVTWSTKGDTRHNTQTQVDTDKQTYAEHRMSQTNKHAHKQSTTHLNKHL